MKFPTPLREAWTHVLARGRSRGKTVIKLTASSKTADALHAHQLKRHSTVSYSGSSAKSTGLSKSSCLAWKNTRRNA